MGLRVIGGLLVAFGTIWVLQGLGLLDWPKGSVMLARREWALYGVLTAALGVGAMWLSRSREGN